MTLVYLLVIPLVSIAILWRYRRHARGLTSSNDQLYRSVMSTPPVAFGGQIAAAILIFLSLMLMVVLFDTRRSGRHMLSMDIRPYAAITGIVGVIAAYSIHARARAKWIRAMKESDGALCPHCGYSLRGLPDHQNCPECGRLYDLENVRTCWRNWLGR